MQNTAGEHGTTGFGGGGATARPAEASGRDLKGERLSDFEGQGGQVGRRSQKGSNMLWCHSIMSLLCEQEEAVHAQQTPADSMLLRWSLLQLSGTIAHMACRKLATL